MVNNLHLQMLNETQFQYAQFVFRYVLKIWVCVWKEAVYTAIYIVALLWYFRRFVSLLDEIRSASCCHRQYQLFIGCLSSLVLERVLQLLAARNSSHAVRPVYLCLQYMQHVKEVNDIFT